MPIRTRARRSVTRYAGCRLPRPRAQTVGELLAARDGIRAAHGFSVIMLSDAVCSGADETHAAAVDLLGDRFTVQFHPMTTNDFLSKVQAQGPQRMQKLIAID